MGAVTEILFFPVRAHILSVRNEIRPITEIVSISAQARFFSVKAMSCIVSLKYQILSVFLPRHIYSVTVIVTDVTLHIVQAQHGSAVVVVVTFVLGFGAAAHLVFDHLQNRQRRDT